MGSLAALPARMGALLERETRTARSDALTELKELHIAHEALVQDRTAARNRAEIQTLALLKRQNARAGKLKLNVQICSRARK